MDKPIIYIAIYNIYIQLNTSLCCDHLLCLTYNRCAYRSHSYLYGLTPLCCENLLCLTLSLPHMFRSGLTKPDEVSDYFVLVSIISTYFHPLDISMKFWSFCQILEDSLFSQIIILFLVYSHIQSSYVAAILSFEFDIQYIFHSKLVDCIFFKIDEQYVCFMN